MATCFQADPGLWGIVPWIESNCRHGRNHLQVDCRCSEMITLATDLFKTIKGPEIVVCIT